MARIATHCTEADISEQHIQMAKKLDMEAIGFLSGAHELARGSRRAGALDSRIGPTPSTSQTLPER